MPGAAGAYLPPIVASLLSDADDAMRGIAEVKTALEDLEKTPTEVKVTADTGTAVAEVATARSEMDAIASKPVTFHVTADTAGALSSIAAGRVAGGGGGGGGFLTGLLAGGGAGRGGGLLSTLLWGGGSNLGIPGTRYGLGGAGGGSLASFAGLGVEHLLMTLLGIGGSATAALGGGALLGAGSLGTMAVGSGSDMAVMKSTLADTQLLSKAYTKLQQDVLLYGANSKQAAADQTLLNQQMAILGNTAGVQAELALAKSAAALNLFWDQQTSGARVAATNIMQQVVTLGTVYTPLVASAAQRNLTIINDSLKPLFAWLEGPQGIGIFKDLENAFAANLPNAVAAFTQGIEFLLKTLDVLSLHTGGFTAKIGDLLTKANSPEGFQKWETIMNHLIADWDLWKDIVKNLGIDLYQLFSRDANTAQSILTWLDQMLIKIGQWEKSTSGSAAIHNIFEVHKQEVMALLSLLPALVTSFGHIYLAVAPALVMALTTVLQAITPIINALAHDPFGAWVLGISLILGKLGLLGGALGLVWGVLAKIAGWVLPSSLLNLLHIGGAGQIGSGISNLAGDVQKVYVVNMPPGGLAGGAPTAAEGAAGGSAAAGGEGLLGALGVSSLPEVGVLIAGLLPGFALLYGGLAIMDARQKELADAYNTVTPSIHQSLLVASDEWQISGLNSQQIADGTAALNYAFSQGKIKSSGDLNLFIQAWAHIAQNGSTSMVTTSQISDLMATFKQRAQTQFDSFILFSKNSSADLSRVDQTAAQLPAGVQKVIDAVAKLPTPTGNIHTDLDNIDALLKSPALQPSIATIGTIFHNSVPTTGQVSSEISNLLGQVTTGAQATSLLQGTLWKTNTISNPLPPSTSALVNNVNTAAGGMWNIYGGFNAALGPASALGGRIQGLIGAINSGTAAAADIARRLLSIVIPSFLQPPHLGAQHGTVGNFGAGTPMMLHGVEAVLAKDRTDPALWQAAVASIRSGGSVSRPTMPMGGSVPLGASSAPGHTFQITAPITIHVPNTNATPRQVGDAAEEAVNRVWTKVLRGLGGGAYALQPG